MSALPRPLPDDAPNLVLIGPPGCGKTVLGRRLARELRLPFVDTDALVEAAAGHSIPQLFATAGEAAFRALEARCVAQAATLRGTVIATGGGVPLCAENMRALTAHGLIVFIDRTPARILRATKLDDRPLLAGGRERLYALYRARLPVYRHYAAYTVCNRKRLKPLVLAVANHYRNKVNRYALSHP